MIRKETIWKTSNGKRFNTLEGATKEEIACQAISWFRDNFTDENEDYDEAMEPWTTEEVITVIALHIESLNEEIEKVKGAIHERQLD